MSCWLETVLHVQLLKINPLTGLLRFTSRMLRRENSSWLSKLVACLRKLAFHYFFMTLIRLHSFQAQPRLIHPNRYYLLYGDNIQAFPKGFSMIAGNNDLRNFSNYPVPDVDKSNWNVAPYNTQDFLRQAALGFNCLNYAATPEASLYRHFLPDKAYLDANCADGVRFELMFPSCWNKAAGVAPPDSRSHMAYPSTVMSGDCPEGFDTRLPSLFYETIWNTAAYKGVDGEFVVSNGDPTGYGYHGDFIMGWDVDFLQSAVDTCTNLSGRIEDCPLFDIQDESVWGTCSIDIPSNIKGDDVTGPMDALPGDNPIQSGPGLATSGSIPVNTGKASSTKSSSTSTKASSSKATTTSAVVPTLPYSAGSSIGKLPQFTNLDVSTYSIPHCAPLL